MRIVAVIVASSLLICGCGIPNPKSIPRPLGKKSTFALYVVSATSGANTKTDIDPENGAEIYLTDPALITTADVASVHLSKGTPANEPPSLTVNLKPEAAAKLLTATATLGGMKLSIVVNDHVVAVATVHSSLSNSISLSNGKAEAILDSLTRD